MPGITVDDHGTALLVGPDYVSEFFGIELRGEGSGADQVTEHHRQLAPLGFHTWRRGEGPGSPRGEPCAWHWRLGDCLRLWGQARPHQHLALLVACDLLPCDHLVPEIGQRRLIEIKFALERPVGDPPLAL